MAEKSGLEMLEDMRLKLEAMERRFSNMEFMLKELLNRVNGGEKKQQQEKPVISATAELPKIDNIAPNCACPTPTNKVAIGQVKKEIKIGDPPVNSQASNTDGKIKILGQIKNKDGRLVSGVNVKIFNASNQIVKETKTNRAGEWMCLLPSGKYKAEYLLDDIVSGSVNFNALPGQTLVRVAQPTK